MAGIWNYLIAEPGQDEALASEYLAQFDGYDPALVDQAATEAIGDAAKGPPSPGAIKAKIRAKLTQDKRASERYEYRKTYDYSELPDYVLNEPEDCFGSARRLMAMGCSPGYIVWRHYDRRLTREAAAKGRAMTPAQIAEHERAQRIMGGSSKHRTAV